MSEGIKKFLPKSLLGRSLLIIVTPLVLLQVVTALIFWESHWDKVSRRLASNFAGEVAFIIAEMSANPAPETWWPTVQQAERHLSIEVTFHRDAILPNRIPPPQSALEETVLEALQDRVKKPVRVDAESLETNVKVEVQLSNGVVEVQTPRKHLFSSTTYVFVIWMVGISLILFAVATVFMRNQVRPIRRLAHAADAFGKGRDVERFKPEGAAEVRQAAQAFIAMRDRIQRQIKQRTDMLSGVSHDLRTPLTRMKLQLAMSKQSDETRELLDDIHEMEHMLEEYLAFARGEGHEQPTSTDLSALLKDVVERARRKGGRIDLHCEGQLMVPLRRVAFQRCITNLVENAMRFGEHVSLRAGQRGDNIEISVDDDGPGIPEEQRDDVFKPFFRIEGSRNQKTGGVGLGLTIARDVVRGHGGEIKLSEAPLGGLRVKVRLPL